MFSTNRTRAIKTIPVIRCIKKIYKYVSKIYATTTHMFLPEEM